MIQANIKFSSPEDISKFVSTVSKFDTDIDIRYRNALLDGKSIQALYDIQLNADITCIIHDTKDGASDIINGIREFLTSEFIDK